MVADMPEGDPSDPPMAWSPPLAWMLASNQQNIAKVVGYHTYDCVSLYDSVLAG